MTFKAALMLALSAVVMLVICGATVILIFLVAGSTPWWIGVPASIVIAVLGLTTMIYAVAKGMED